MKRSTTIRIISYCIAAAVATGGCACSGWYRARKAEQALHAGYTRAYQQLSADLSGLSNGLDKAALCEGKDSFLQLSADLCRDAGTAARTLEGLPIQGSRLSSLGSYVNKIADYADALGKSCAAGKALTDTDRKNLQILSEMAQALCTCVSGDCTGSYEKKYFSASGASLSGLDSMVDSLQESLDQTPVLLYDGPYSDHITQNVPACIKDNKEISSAEAIRKVAEMLSLSPEEITLEGNGQGKIPVWCLAYSLGNTRCSLQLTKNGGIPLLLLSGCSGETKMSKEDALARCTDLVEGLGFGPLSSTYFYEEGGVLYVNFASSQDGVLCYPDLVQAGIELSGGNLCYLQAQGYAANHRNRTGLSPALSQTQAEKKLPGDVEIKGCQLCVIPTDGKNERLCYEFHTLSGQREYLYYIDADTGATADILRLLYSDNGTLTV